MSDTDTPREQAGRLMWYADRLRARAASLDWDARKLMRAAAPALPEEGSAG